MAAGLSLSSAATRFGRHHYLSPKRRSATDDGLLFPFTTRRYDSNLPFPISSSRRLDISFVMRDHMSKTPIEEGEKRENAISDEKQISAVRLAEKLARKRSEQSTYLIAAIMSSFGITSMAIAAVYLRFSWQMEDGEVPLSEMFGTFALSVGAAVGMEFWARWAHRALWHASLWHMHESHHRPREGPFELNDVFAIINAVPAIGLLSYGFFNKGLVPGLCFGAGLGITVFGMAYMFAHDGLVHRRFPVGPIANVPYFRRVAAAHQVKITHKNCRRYDESAIMVPLPCIISFPAGSIIQTNSMECRMGCSWDLMNWKRLVAWKSWRRRLTRELRSPKLKTSHVFCGDKFVKVVS